MRNITTLSALILGCFLFVATPSLHADTCDDIARLADQWHKLANYIADHSDGGTLRKNEIQKVSRQTRDLVPPSKDLGNALVKEFRGKQDQRVRAWGKQILAMLEELGGLGEDDDWDEDVKIIDRLVEVIDKVTAECDG